MKLSCVRYMLLLVPRSVVCPLCEGLCLFPQWQHLAVCSVGSGVPVQSVRVPLQPFFSHVVSGLAPVDCHRLVRFFWLVTGTDACKGLLCLMSGFHLDLLIWGGVVQVHYIVCMHGAQCMRHVGIISGVFSSLLYIDKEKRSSCFYFITTRSL